MQIVVADRAEVAVPFACRKTTKKANQPIVPRPALASLNGASQPLGGADFTPCDFSLAIALVGFAVAVALLGLELLRVDGSDASLGVKRNGQFPRQLFRASSSS